MYPRGSFTINWYRQNVYLVDHVQTIANSISYLQFLLKSKQKNIWSQIYPNTGTHERYALGHVK